MTIGADILIVVATVVAVFSLSSIIAAWTARRWPWVAATSFAIAIGLFAYVHFELTEGLVPLDIPDSFISVAARLLN